MTHDLARPTVLSPEVQLAIVTALAEGNYLATACQAAGITYSGFRWWQKRWEEGDPVAQRFADFFESVNRASAVAERSALGGVRAGSPGWQGEAWFLERRFPRRWGKRDRAPVPATPRDLTKMTDDDLERYQRELDGRRTGPGG